MPDFDPNSLFDIEEEEVIDVLPPENGEEETEKTENGEEIEVAEEETPVEEVETGADILLNDIFENLDNKKGEDKEVILPKIIDNKLAQDIEQTSDKIPVEEGPAIGSPQWYEDLPSLEEVKREIKEVINIYKGEDDYTKTKTNLEDDLGEAITGTTYENLPPGNKLELQEIAVKKLEEEYGVLSSEDMEVGSEITPEQIDTKANEIYISMQEDYELQEEDTLIEKVPYLGKNPASNYLGDMYRSFKIGWTGSDALDETFKLWSENPNNENILAWITAVNEQQNVRQTDEMRDFYRIYEEEGKTPWAFIKALSSAPYSVIQNTLASSMGTMIGSLQADEVKGAAATGALVGGGTGSVVPGIGTATGAMAGGFGAGVAMMEAGLTFSELLMEETGNDLTLENVRAVFNDPEKVEDIKRKARNRGIAIGLIEMVTAGLAKGVGSRIISEGGRKTTSALVSGGIEVVGGSTGEVAGRFVAGQEMDVADIALEGIGGLKSGPLTIGSNLLNARNITNELKIRNNLKGSEFNNIIEAFKIDTPTGEAKINITQNPEAINVLDRNLKKAVAKGEITQEESNNIQVNFRETTQAVNQIKAAGVVDIKDQSKAITLLKRKNTLQKQVEAVDDTGLNAIAKEEIKKIDEELTSIIASEIERKETVGMGVVPTKRAQEVEISAQEQADLNQINIDTYKDPNTSETDRNNAAKLIIEDNAGFFLSPKDKGGIDFVTNFEGYRNKDTGKFITRQEVLNEVSALLPGIIGAFNTKGKANFTTYAGASLNAKLPGIKESLIGAKEASKTKEMTAEELAMIPEQKTEKPIGKEFEKRKYPTQIKAIEKQTSTVRPEILGNIKESVKEFIASDVGKIKEIGKKGKRAITKLDPLSVERDLKARNKKTKKSLAAAVGKMNSKQYIDFVNDIINKGYIETIPIAAMKKRFKNVKGFNIEKIDRETLGAGTGIYKLSGLNKQALIDFYTKDQSGYRSFIDLLAKGLTIEQLQEVKTDKDFMNDLSFKLKEDGSKFTAEEFMNEVEKLYDKRTKEKRSLDITTTLIKEIDKSIDSLNKVDKNILPSGISPAAAATILKAALKVLKKGLQAGKSIKIAMQKALNKIKSLVKNINTSIAYSNIFYNNFINTKDINKAAQKTYDDILRWEMITHGNVNDILKYSKLRKAYALETTKPELAKKEVDLFIKDLKENIFPAFPEAFFKPKSKFINYAKQTPYFNEQIIKALNEQTVWGKDFNNVPKNKNGNYTFKEFKDFVGRTELEIRANILNGTIAEQNKINSAVFEQMWERFNNLIKKDKNNAIAIASYLKLSGNLSNHPQRIGAQFTAYQKDIIGEGRIYEMEHAMPNVNSYMYLLESTLNPNRNFNSEFKDIVKNYTVVALGLQDNKKLNKTNLKNKMPQYWTVFDRWFDRYLNKEVVNKTGGINPESLVMMNGNTLAKEFGVDASGIELKNIGEQTINKESKIAQKSIENFAGNIIGKVNQTITNIKQTLTNSLNTKTEAEKVNKKKKGISVFDFDDTLAKTKEKVIVYAPYYGPGKMTETRMELTPAEFAERAQELENAGASFDFSQFENVKNAKKGPLANLALKRQGKFGGRDIFILTARPQTSAQGIKTFLDGIGLNIPIENITGLENGTPQAKADWVLSKTEEGYNDFYFADDAIQNVTAVKQILDQVDVKSKVQQAITDKTINLDKEFNTQIEEATGKEAYKEYSPARARLEGKAKDKGFFKWIGKQLTITPSAEDFMGLMYDIIGKGKQGNRHAQFISDNLMQPFNKAEQAILSAKVTVANDFAALKKAFPSLRTKRGKNPLMQQIGVGPYTKSNAIRVYMWDKQGMDIPGLSKRDQTTLVKAVETDMELKSFADNVILIQKESTYPPPGNNWTGGDISTDILQGLDKGFRNKLMTEFNENAAIIFSEKNMNKLEAIYGTKWTDALKDSLRRMKVGSNRPVYQGGGSRIVNELLDWLNGSVGAIMFLNMRSGLLQTISNINFINWGDNNIYAASKAFASKEYWPTVMKLMNSDYLVNRRDGLKINVNEAELADAAKKSGMKGAIAYMLDKGFIITRIMDSLAIATGGATFYMNRRDALLKRQNPDTGKTYTTKEAETKAFDDFYAISEESQQSSNPSKISQQQASLAGRVILSFQNVTMQYNRKVKKSIRNLYNRRKNPGQTQRESDLGNLSQVIYYTTIQNIIFHSLQQTLFALAFEDETEDEEKDRAASIANGMVDSLLFGLGFGGAGISTVKNILLKIMGQHEKKNPKYEEAVWSLFDFSPVLDSKVRKIKTGLKTFSWNMEEIKKRGWSLDNPAYLAIAQMVSATTNIPIDRVLRKTMNLRAAMDEETRTWQRVALILGWDTWSLGLPYWGLQSTIKKEEKEKAKIKADYKSDIRKIKGMGYKKVMARVLKDYDPKDIIEMQSPAGTVVYYAKTKK